MLTAKRIDHVVLTCRDVAATIRFYTEVLGMREEIKIKRAPRKEPA